MRPEASFDWGEEYPDDTFNFGGFLNERGIPKLCRLELRMTNINELKQAAVTISELNAQLQKLAFEDERDDLLRVMFARDALAKARFHLRYIRSKQAKKAKEFKGPKLKEKPPYGPTSSRWNSFGVGKLNGRWLSDIAAEKEKQMLEQQGEKNDSKE